MKSVCIKRPIEILPSLEDDNNVTKVENAVHEPHLEIKGDAVKRVMDFYSP
ncbi:MAG: hypothetical protein L0H53_04780 [Candidatus Nitrosocosmicus sp.]|nr:hypothetical protein [Candidatus Nitrosocosmicus sp.]